MERVTVVTAANSDYLLPLAVMLRSLATSLPPNASVDVRILTLGLSDDCRDQLSDCLSGLRVEWKEVKVDPSPLEGLKVDGHVSIETYFRLLASYHLRDICKIIYLDPDIIVRHSIVELYREPLGDAYLLAVPHIHNRSAVFESEFGVPSYVARGLPGKTRTFNAGVMVLDLELWRRTDVASTILRYLREYRQQVLWWDQDGLNAVLHSKWRPLGAKWNVMTNHFADFKSWDESLLDEATFDAVRQDPGIIHYTSPSKPWSKDYSGPFLSEWQQVFAKVAPFFSRISVGN